ncbi:plasmid mobilization relaxosome protein MobC [uncultured Tateyamaria sp.]|uniref:plasmid mobilization relaxosome protein MobC n=1 Tax=uncultured Tateyamaria sp. TaxID=455651 RepID=UPI002604154B|nr:plasmid mobilization relaxosome protein MobC [uncultured Tateyamaria sp.]
MTSASQNTTCAFNDTAKPAAISDPKRNRSKRREPLPLVIRLTVGAVATGGTGRRHNYVGLCPGVCACSGSQAGKRRPKDAVADKKAAAEALALLGQSRIANNLNQLAYHANIGTLDVVATERAKIDEAYAHVLAIRALLVTALGKSS